MRLTIFLRAVFINHDGDGVGLFSLHTQDGTQVNMIVLPLA